MYLRSVDNFGKFKPLYVGKHHFPMIFSNTTLVSDNLIAFNHIKSSKSFDCGIHFFLDDYQFERVWREPNKYVGLLSKFSFVLSPDFSLYLDMPKAMQIWNKFKNQWIGAYLQANGINVIPTVSWSDEESYDWCFDGIEPQSIVAVSSVGCLKDAQSLHNFLHGYNAMLKKLNPTQILFYGSVPKEIDSNILVKVKSYQSKFQNRSE